MKKRENFYTHTHTLSTAELTQKRGLKNCEQVSVRRRPPYTRSLLPAEWTAADASSTLSSPSFLAPVLVLGVAVVRPLWLQLMMSKRRHAARRILTCPARRVLIALKDPR